MEKIVLKNVFRSSSKKLEFFLSAFRRNDQSHFIFMRITNKRNKTPLFRQHLHPNSPNLCHFIKKNGLNGTNATKQPETTRWCRAFIQ